MSQLFTSVYSEFNINAYLLCTLASITLAILLALVHRQYNHTSNGFFMTLVLIPVIVQTVLMLVNGNIGTGIAVAGAFSLVKFRSRQLKEEEIAVIFTALAIGLATSTGYLFIAALFTLIASILLFVLNRFAGSSLNASHLLLKMSVPEGLNYLEVFKDVFADYASQYELINVKTTNMGSLFSLTYDIVLLDPAKKQQFINDLRIRNGNLEISLGLFPEAYNQ